MKTSTIPVFIGIYIFIEASERKDGDKARIISGWLNANETLCLQFWYHMYGKHIGALTVILKTNHSENLIWQKRGNLGDKWMFAQTTLKHKEKYKVSSNMQPKAKLINNKVRKMHIA
jgi:hypothetical protein